MLCNKIKLISLLGLTLFLVACQDHSSKSAQSDYVTVVSTPASTSLYYSGTILPLQSVVVTSPADGVIDNVNFHYGDTVKAATVLFSISSEKFLSDYKAAVMQYIKAKRDLSLKKNQLSESEFLHKNQLISSDDFKSKQSEFYDSQLAFLQAKDAVTLMLKRIDLKGFNLYDLKIEEIDKITQVLRLQGDSQRLLVTAPVTGVGLLPMATEPSSDGAKHYAKGDLVKQGDVLALMGDLSGLRIRIEVNEFNVNQLKIGQKVKVTGAAFPEFVLQGKIASIDRQAQVTQGNAPLFPVEIVIPALSRAQQAIIHVGMSAKVEIEIVTDDQIVLPMNAVYEKAGLPCVRVKDKSGNIKEVVVKTGQATVSGVVIVDGLKVGDKVLVN